MTRAAANAAATADALLAWLETQVRVGTNATPANNEGCPEDIVSAQEPVGSPGVPEVSTLDVPAAAPTVYQDIRAPRSTERAEAECQVAPMRLAHTDWLYHRLAIVGAADQLAAFRRAAAGAGIIPWQIDLDRLEEDVFHLLVAPPPPRPRTLSVAGARVLAEQLREAVGRRHERAVARVGVSRACPFDLHALVPVPDHVLRLGPDDPKALAWLWEHWGTTQPLRHVTEDIAGYQDALHRFETATEHDAIHFIFWSADWTPWHALAVVAKSWPALRFDVCPTYGGS
jgi:hypothetical protein